MLILKHASWMVAHITPWVNWSNQQVTLNAWRLLQYSLVDRRTICIDSKATVMQPLKAEEFHYSKDSFDWIFINNWSLKRASKFKGTHRWWREERCVINRGFPTILQLSFVLHHSWGFKRESSNGVVYINELYSQTRCKLSLHQKPFISF